MDLRCLIGVSFIFACTGCAMVDSGSPPAAPQVAAKALVAAKAPVVQTERILTPLDDPESQYVCEYEVPTGTRIRELVCKPLEDVLRDRKTLGRDESSQLPRLVAPLRPPQSRK